MSTEESDVSVDELGDFTPLVLFSFNTEVFRTDSLHIAEKDSQPIRFDNQKVE